jgi:phospholipase C
MGYYDGNSTTALWNYAQYFAMSDNSYNTTFGPSTPGVINLVAGNTYGADLTHANGDLSGVVIGGTTAIGDADPFYDDCSSTTNFAMTGTNVGDLLNAANITWGWFQGGFAPTSSAGGVATCGASSINLSGATVADYSPHHQPFQYYASTANPHHLPPSSTFMIGKTDQANHQYDLVNFWQAAYSHRLPEVSFLKAKKAQDGHAGYSSPLDEQIFLVQTLNALQELPAWKNMAVIIAYDDSDGWYDHVMPPIVSQSSTTADALTGPGSCGSAIGVTQQGKCGYGPRLPLLVISPWAKVNYVDHAITDQSSILRFIEDNWNLGRIGGGSYDEKAGSLLGMFDFRSGDHTRKLFLAPSTGVVLHTTPEEPGN